MVSRTRVLDLRRRKGAENETGEERRGVVGICPCRVRACAEVTGGDRWDGGR
jgi:hypothetical protein